MKKPLVEISTSALRIEFDGQLGPSRIVVPIIIHPGTHSNVCIRILPRPGVAIENRVELGDAFQATFSKGHSTSVGGSFFVSASHARTYGLREKAYEVVSLPDFCGVLFTLYRYEVKDESIGLQLSFPIRSFESKTEADYFADIRLESDSSTLFDYRIPREVHPKAGKILLLTGYTNEFHQKIYGNKMISPFSGYKKSLISFSDLVSFKISDLKEILKEGYDAIHLYTNISRGLLVADDDVNPDDFFMAINGFGLKFIYIDTCNSVQVVSSFRITDLSALVAATDNLYVKYADEFESRFYKKLSEGAYISEAFNFAALAQGEKIIVESLIRSGTYNPMFLDLKADFKFGE